MNKPTNKSKFGYKGLGYTIGMYTIKVEHRNEMPSLNYTDLIYGIDAIHPWGFEKPNILQLRLGYSKINYQTSLKIKTFKKWH